MKVRREMRAKLRLPVWRRNLLTFHQTRDAAAAHCIQASTFQCFLPSYRNITLN